MKYSDVLTNHIYNVDFDPVKTCEFDRKHLAIVLKKNKDKQTALVVPLTRSLTGDGTNKVNIGKISSLPNNLKTSNSYLVYNQVRTLNCTRFYPLKDEFGNRMECPVDDELFKQVVKLCLKEITSIMSLEDQMTYHHAMYIVSVMQQVVNVAYTIKRLIEGNATETEITYHSKNLLALLEGNPSYDEHQIEKVHRDNGIVEIISKCLNGTIIPIPSEKATG